MKIIINALSGNGDALMFSPALKLLRMHCPDARIDMLVMFRSVKEMYENHPSIDNIYYIDLMKQSKLRSLSDIRNIRNNDYDFSINIYPSNRIEYNIVNSLLGARTKISHHYIHSSLASGEFLNDILVDEKKNRHNVLQNLDLAGNIVTADDASAGPMEIFISEADKEKSLQWLSDNDLNGRRLAGIHAGSSTLKNHIHKRWGKKGYAEIVKYLEEEKDMRVLLFGTEYELNREIMDLSGGHGIIASNENFMDSIARMKHCSIFISNDTAFMHCAAALQLPTVAIFGYTNSKELYPWMTRHVVVRKDLLCSPCFYNSPKPASCIFEGHEEFKCLKLIETSEVIEAMENLL